MIAFWGLLAFRGLGRLLPSAMLDLLSGLLAGIAFLALPDKRSNILRNMRVILGATPEYASPPIERRARWLAWREMLSYGRVLGDLAVMPRLLDRVYVDTEKTPGWEHLDRVLADGRGAVFVTAHYGHWDFAGAAVTRHSPPGRIFAVTEEFKNQRINDLIIGERIAYGLGVVPMDNVRQMLRVLREGNILGILVDRPVGPDDGVTVRFFGRPTQFPAGAATLAVLARCPILPGYLRRRRDGHFEGVILPPIEPVHTGNRAADLSATMQHVVDALESVIRRSPSQWYMFREMWPVLDAPPVTRSMGAWWRPMGAAALATYRSLPTLLVGKASD